MLPTASKSEYTTKRRNSRTESERHQFALHKPGLNSTRSIIIDTSTKSPHPNSDDQQSSQLGRKIGDKCRARNLIKLLVVEVLPFHQVEFPLLSCKRPRPQKQASNRQQQQRAARLFHHKDNNGDQNKGNVEYACISLSRVA